jgi:NADP-dependent 3-hydroxy acid dehydrogenase YdfG
MQRFRRRSNFTMTFILRDHVVVLTGTASGIGAALAQKLASEGANLALIDRDGHGLEAVADTVRRTPIKRFNLKSPALEHPRPMG